jgi:hypothetical protein
MPEAASSLIVNVNQVTGGVSIPDDRLESHHELRPSQWAPAGFLLNLPGCDSRRILGVIDIAAGQFPHPPVDDQPMPPHQQDPVLVIHDDRRRGAAHAHDVLLELGTVRQPDRSVSKRRSFSTISGPAAIPK